MLVRVVFVLCDGAELLSLVQSNEIMRPKQRREVAPLLAVLVWQDWILGVVTVFFAANER